jgi:hypothetical protein
MGAGVIFHPVAFWGGSGFWSTRPVAIPSGRHFVLKVARWHGAKGRGKGSTWAHHASEGEGRRGGGVGSRTARMIALGGAVSGGSMRSRWGRAHEQGRAARRGRRGANVTDRRDWGEKGPGGSGWGAREKERTGQRWGTNMRVRASQFKLDLKQKSKFKWFKTFSNHFKIG